MSQVSKLQGPEGTWRGLSVHGMAWDELISHLIWMYVVTQVYALLGSKDTAPTSGSSKVMGELLKMQLASGLLFCL